MAVGKRILHEIDSQCNRDCRGPYLLIPVMACQVASLPPVNK